MRISIININLVAQDAIGQCMINQWRFFTRRGDDVVIFTQHPPTGVSDELKSSIRVSDLAKLSSGRDDHFSTSDLYVYHYPSRYLLMETMPGLERGSVILYFHNVTPPELWNNPVERGALQHSLDSVGYFARYADLIVTPSDFNAQDLIANHGCAAERIRVLPLAVPIDVFRYRPKPHDLLERYGLAGKKVLLFVGRLASNKRIDILIRALSQLRTVEDRIKLLIVGDYSGNEALRETHGELVSLAGNMGVLDKVIFTGRVDDLASYYHLADIYVTASQHEGFGVPLIEAMASGTPVVASDVAAHPWVLGDAGCLVPGEEPAAYANAIMTLLQDEELYGGYVKKGHERVQDFSIERYEARWYEIVTELMAWQPASGYARNRSLRNDILAAHDGVADGDVRVGDVLQLSALRDKAFGMHRNFRLSSRIPLLGSLITWIRRNLTSHIKAEFDPLFDNQIKFNRELVRTLYAVQSHLAHQHSEEVSRASMQQDSIVSLEWRLKLLASEIQLMQTRLTLMQAENKDLPQSDTLASLKQDLNALTEKYQELRTSIIPGENHD